MRRSLPREFQYSPSAVIIKAHRMISWHDLVLDSAGRCRLSGYCEAVLISVAEICAALAIADGLWTVTSTRVSG